MKYCVRCVYPENHPLGLTFSDEGVCSGCLVHEEKYEIDWATKEKEFAKLVGYYKNSPTSDYDCIIPVTGIGDDFYVVDLIKNKYGLNPLLVTYNSQFNTKVGIRNLARLATVMDCDHILSTIGPDTVKKVTKETLNLIGDMYWHVLCGSQTFPVQVATKFRIPLIIWRNNGWMDQVGMFSHHDMVEMTKKVRKEHGLRMLDAEELLERSEVLTSKDLIPYMYPSDEQLEKSKVRGIYINNFFFWDSKKQTEEAIDKHGYETLKQERTYNTYETIHCHNNANIHDYIKYLKYGYGKATDHAARDIRLKRMSRDTGQAMVEKYDSLKPSNLNDFLEWLGMTETELMGHVNKFRDERIWTNHKGTWELNDKIGNHTLSAKDKAQQLEVIESCVYRETPLLEEEESKYILSGRGYMDEHNYWAERG
ncbi:MAG: N-acetyl sugar amidotransferase [Bdellovibrionales bacterium]|nr:N-acetyl sugar amidotransferase [Bdellovibrionales bacterium]